ncbi:MAG: hypothetical protein KJ621_14820, partial [Proteobacteria bacterium]|nr:hypothetical protein [Pseudomonadota bacterium]
MRRIVGGALGLVGLMGLYGAAGPTAAPRDLGDLDRKIDRHKLKLKRMDQREQQVLEQIRTISRRLTAEKTTIAALARRLDHLRPQVRTTRLWIEAMDLSLERRRRYFSRRLRAYYKFAAPGGSGFVAGARQADEAALRFLYLRFVLRHDRQVLAAWLAERTERRRLTRHLVGLQQVVTRTIRAKRLRFRRTLELSGRRYLLLRQLRRRKAAASDLVADLSLARLRLRLALARGTLGPEGRAASPPARGG